ncbi:MAG: hypothetical protein KF773_39600 [Deltaproteobacteria bacterium]|nr:hypothetical protein [Deltaproteobacteria bacterium]
MSPVVRALVDAAFSAPASADEDDDEPDLTASTVPPARRGKAMAAASSLRFDTTSLLTTWSASMLDGKSTAAESTNGLPRGRPFG